MVLVVALAGVDGDEVMLDAAFYATRHVVVDGGKTAGHAYWFVVTVLWTIGTLHFWVVEVNGMHKETVLWCITGEEAMQAGKEMGKEGMTCEIFMDLAPLNPEDRRLAEAKLFAKQSDAVERLTAVQKHSANIILGTKENVLLHELCKKYHVNEKPVGVGGRAVFHNTVTAMSTALKIAKKDINYLNDVFDIVCSAGWNNGTNGFSDNVLYCLEWILEYHPDSIKEIKETLIEYFRGVDPDIVQAKGIAKYPMRHKSIAMTLEVEDYLHEVLGIPYTFTEVTLEKLNKKGA